MSQPTTNQSTAATAEQEVIDHRVLNDPSEALAPRKTRTEASLRLRRLRRGLHPLPLQSRDQSPVSTSIPEAGE